MSRQQCIAYGRGVYRLKSKFRKFRLNEHNLRYIPKGKLDPKCHQIPSNGACSDFVMNKSLNDVLIKLQMLCTNVVKNLLLTHVPNIKLFII